MAGTKQIRVGRIETVIELLEERHRVYEQLIKDYAGDKFFQPSLIDGRMSEIRSTIHLLKEAIGVDDVQ